MIKFNKAFQQTGHKLFPSRYSWYFVMKSNYEMLSAMEVGFEELSLFFDSLITFHPQFIKFGGLATKYVVHAIFRPNPSWNRCRALPPDQLLSGQKLQKSSHLRALVSAGHSCSVQLNGKSYHLVACVLCNHKKQIRCNSFLWSSEAVFVKVF